MNWDWGNIGDVLKKNLDQALGIEEKQLQTQSSFIPSTSLVSQHSSNTTLKEEEEEDKVTDEDKDKKKNSEEIVCSEQEKDNLVEPIKENVVDDQGKQLQVEDAVGVDEGKGSSDKEITAAEHSGTGNDTSSPNENENAELYAQINDLKAKLKKANQTLEEQTLTKEKELASIKAEREQIRKLQDKFLASEELTKAKDQQIAAVLAEGEVLSQKQSKMELAMRSLRKTVNEQEKEIESLKGKNAADAEQIKTLSAKIDELSGSEKEKSLRVSELMEELKKTSQNKSEKEKNFTIQESKIQELVKSNDELKEQVENLKEFEEKAKLLASEAAKLFSENSKITREFQDREAQQLQAIRNLNGEFEKFRSSSQDREKQLNEEINRLQLVLNEVVQKNQDQLTLLPDATKPLLIQIDSLKTSISMKESSWQVLEAKLRDQIQELQNALRDFQSQNIVLNEGKCHYEKALDVEKADKLSLRERLSSLEIENSQLKSKLELSLFRLVQSEEETKQLQENLAKSLVNDNVDILQKKLQKLEEQLGIERNYRESLEKQIESLKNSKDNPDTPSKPFSRSRVSFSSEDFFLVCSFLDYI
jgi:chromosome segregation ATPase